MTSESEESGITTSEDIDTHTAYTEIRHTKRLKRKVPETTNYQREVKIGEPRD